MAKYGSESKKVTPNVGLRTNRYQYLALEDAEPNLGFTSEKVLPIKSNYYQLVSFDGGTVYDRYWQVAPAGIITGISIFDEGFIVGTGNSINKLDFRGNIITATANNFGTISTITVAPPGSDTQLIYNSSGNFAASANLTFSSNTLFVTGLGSFSQGSYNQNIRIGIAGSNIIDTTSGNLVLNANSGITSIKSVLLAGITTFSESNSSNLVTLSQTGTGNALYANGTVISGVGSIGIGTTIPTQELDINGDIRLRGTIYDYNNLPGANGQILLKNSLGGLDWVNVNTVQTGAGGTYTSVQYQTYAGIMGGANNFVYEPTSSRVGIGSTQPQYLLDVLGYSRFTGQTEIVNLRVTGVTTVGFLTGTNAYFSGIITATTFNGNATSTSYASTSGVSTSVIGGIASVTQLYVSSGVSTLASLEVIGLTTTQNFRVTGVSTVGFISASNLYVSGISTLTGARINNVYVGTVDNNTISTPTGNLTLDSFAGTTVIKDILFVNDTTQTTSITDGALVVGGGAGIKNDLNVGGYIAIAGTFGVTGTSYPNQLITSGIASFTNTTQSTNKDNGSVVVEGGVGIEKNLNVGGASSISGIVTFGSNVLPFNNSTQDIGSASQRWNNIWATTFNGKFLGNADTAGYATTAGMSTNLVGGSAGVIPYQNGTNSTSFTQVGTAKSLLQSNGTSAPTWINPGTLNVAYASSSGISTNIKGGSAGQIPYQSNIDTTLFTQVGTANSLLQSNGSGAPTWIDPGALNVAYASSAGISTNIKGGTAGQIPYQSGANTTLFTQVGTAGSLLQSNGSSAPTWVQPSQLSVQFAGYATTAGVSTNIKGGSAGVIPYQSNIDTTLFTQVGTAGSLLQSNGSSAPTWVSPQGLFVQNAGYATTAGYASTAGISTYAIRTGIATYATSSGITTYATTAGLSTNLVGVAVTGQVPWQSADNQTSFTSGGIGGNLLQYNGLSGPIWASPQGLTIGYALTAGISTYATRSGIATYTDTAGVSTNLKSVASDNGQIPWQKSAGITSFTTGGTPNSSLLQYGGATGPSWVSPSNLTIANAGYAITAGIATNINGGIAGQILYQSNTDITSFVQVGSAGSILVGDGANGPKWINPSIGFNVASANYASNAGVATNLANGSAGQIPYQSGNNQTGFIPVGTANSILQSNGTNIPSWVSPSNLTIQNAGYATTAGLSTNIKGGATGSIPYQSSTDITAFLPAASANGQLLQYSIASNGPAWVSPSNLTIQNANYATEAGAATSLKGGTAGQVAYQYTIGITSFTSGGSSGNLLQWGGALGPSWVSPSNLTIQNAGYATTAGVSTNIKGGTAGQIPYQSNANITSFISVGAAGSILSSNGTGAPTWINPSLGFNVDSANYASNAGVSTNLANGSAGQIPYQSGNNRTGFIPVGSAGSVLSSNGTGIPTWINPGASGAKPIVNNDTTNIDRYLTFVAGNSGVQDLYVDSSDLKYNPSSNTLTIPRIKTTLALGVGPVSTDIATWSTGEIRATNNITAYVSSDINLKTNIKPIADPIEKLSQINGVSFDWKDEYIAERGGEDGYFVRKHDIGVIAQEIEKVLPEIVVTRENGTKAIKYELLAPLLIEAIKEQQETIINLKRRIESLEK